MENNLAGNKHKKESLSENAEKSPPDKQGQLPPAEQKKDPATKHPSTTPVSHKSLTALLQNEIKVEKTNDENTLIDVHVNNPLKRIQELLEEIKKQKAFTFSIKGSLGVAGIILMITTFGIFGGTKAFCDKGIQTRTGRVLVLSMSEEFIDPSLPWWQKIIENYLPSPKPATNRIVLIPPSGSPIRIVSTNTNQLKTHNNQQTIITGTLDACSQTLTITDPNSIEIYNF